MPRFLREFRLQTAAMFTVICELVAAYDSPCIVENQVYASGKFFVHKSYFNASCNDGKITVHNCVTDRGTRLELGTLSYEENGFNYTCKSGAARGHAPKLLESGDKAAATTIANECERGAREFVRDGFAISCDSFAFLGCVDAYGDLVRAGIFVTARGALRDCYVYANRRRARIERRGCFNGSHADDPNDARFHMRRGAIWRTQNYDYRCNDLGLEVYKCKPSPKERYHTVSGGRCALRRASSLKGSAWFDRDDILNICHLD